MGYKIALASSDGITVDRSFGGAEQYIVYEISKHRKYGDSEVRAIRKGDTASEQGSGGSQNQGGSGCGCQKEHPGVSMLADCRCIVCKTIGLRIEKQLEKKAIAAFAVECSVEEALEKITMYYDRLDHSQTMREIAHEQ